MSLRTARARWLLLALALLAAVPVVLPQGGDSAQSDPDCDYCHYAHNAVYHAYLDITAFTVPPALDGSDRKEVKVTLHLYGSVGLGYTTISRGYLDLTSVDDRVAIENPHKDYNSYNPGYRSFYWNVSGRLAGTDHLHVSVYGLGVHLGIEFREQADSGNITVTNPLNAAPRITFTRPNGFEDPEADASYTIGILAVDPNSDHVLVDIYYDNDTNRSNGQVLIARGLLDPKAYTWDTHALPEGWYWLHADADDQRGGHDSTTSNYPVIVTHHNRVPSVSLRVPNNRSVVHTPAVQFGWIGSDADGDVLTYYVYVGRDAEHMELVGTTQNNFLSYRPPDNARLVWTVLPRDAHVLGWCRDGVWAFSTDISYPVEVSLILPANGSTVEGPSAKLVWAGIDLDYEQVFYDIYLDQGTGTTLVARDWDDPAGPVYIAADLVPGATYAWRIVGHNPWSQSGISKTWRFSVAAGGAPAAVLLGEEVARGSVHLRWGPAAGPVAPVRYDVHLVGPDRGDEAVLVNTTLNETTMTGLREGQTYRWYVVPRDALGHEGPCEPQFRVFNCTTNHRPEASAVEPRMTVPPGTTTIRWTASDADGDRVLFDVYIDDMNATTLLVGSLDAREVTVDLRPERTYRWRAVPRDQYGPGAEAEGVIVVGPDGVDVAVTGGLASPPDGARLAGSVVVLSWNATDPLGRPVLSDVYLDTAGGDPLARAPVAVRVEGRSWSVGPLAVGTTARWAVRARAEGGPYATLGTRSFTVVGKSEWDPVARLSVAGVVAGAPVNVECFKEVGFNASSSEARVAGGLAYWFDFGDGNVSGWTQLPRVVHVYQLAGRYNATLVVRDALGRQSPPMTVAVTAEPGDKRSAEGLPGYGGPMAAAVIAVTATLASVARKGRRRGVG